MSIRKSFLSISALLLMTATSASVVAYAQTDAPSAPNTNTPPAAQNSRQPIRPLKRLRKNLRNRAMNRQHKQCDGSPSSSSK
jgi:hypothetical protein